MGAAWAFFFFFFFLHHRGVLGCVWVSSRGGWGCVWKCVCVCVCVCLCASQRPQCAACLTWLHPDLLARASKHEPVLLHTGKINHLLDSWGHLRFSLVPAALKELGCGGKCVCVCVCVPLGRDWWSYCCWQGSEMVSLENETKLRTTFPLCKSQ